MVYFHDNMSNTVNCDSIAAEYKEPDLENQSECSIVSDIRTPPLEHETRSTPTFVLPHTEDNNNSILSLDSECPDVSVRLTSTPKKKKASKPRPPRKRNKSALTTSDYTTKHTVCKKSQSVTVVGSDIPVYHLNKPANVDQDSSDSITTSTNNNIRYYLWNPVSALISQISREYSNQGFKFMLPLLVDVLDAESFLVSGRNRWIREDVLFTLLKDKTRFTESITQKQAVLTELQNSLKSKPVKYKNKNTTAPSATRLEFNDETLVDICDVSMIAVPYSDDLPVVNEPHPTSLTGDCVGQNHQLIESPCPVRSFDTDNQLNGHLSSHVSSTALVSDTHLIIDSNCSYLTPSFSTEESRLGSIIQSKDANHDPNTSLRTDSQKCHINPLITEITSAASVSEMHLDSDSILNLQLTASISPVCDDSSTVRDLHLSTSVDSSSLQMNNDSSTAMNLQLSTSGYNSSIPDESVGSINLPLSDLNDNSPEVCDTPDQAHSGIDSSTAMNLQLSTSGYNSSIPDESVGSINSRPSDLNDNSSEVCDTPDQAHSGIDSSTASNLQLNTSGYNYSIPDESVGSINSRPSDLNDNSSEVSDAPDQAHSGIDANESPMSKSPAPNDVNSPVRDSPETDMNHSINAEQIFEHLLEQNGNDSAMFDLSNQSNLIQEDELMPAESDDIPPFVGTFQFWNQNLEFLLKDKHVYLPVGVLCEKCELSDHVYKYKNSFRFIEASIAKNIPDVDVTKTFIRDKRGRRTHMCVLTLSRVLPFLTFGKKSMAYELQEVLVGIIDSQVCNKKSKVPQNFSYYLQNHTKTQVRKEISDSLMASNTKSDKPRTTAEDFIQILLMKETLSREKIIKKIICALMNTVNPISEFDLINLAETCKGQKLIEELRRLMGFILPSRAQEKDARKKIETYFSATLLPHRTSTGDAINMSRLVEILALRYPQVTHPEQIEDWSCEDSELKVRYNNKLILRYTGDGFTFGGDPATFDAVSVANNGIINHQSPKHCYPLSVFSGGDNRNNLVQNLTKPTNRIADCMQEDSTASLCELYGSSDEKFLMNMLDDDGILSSASKDDYNPYAHTDLYHKDLVAWPSGKRTDLKPLFDREHPHKIMPIPMTRLPPDEMHMSTRIIEKSCNLELQICVSEGNKRDVLRAVDKSLLTGHDLVANFANNIRAKGIKRHIIFWEEDGTTLKPISLSNTAAMGILAPSENVDTISPQSADSVPVAEIGVIVETTDKDTHILRNVVGRRIIVLQGKFKDSVRLELKLPTAMTEYDLVKLLWESLHHMLMVLRTEPNEECRGLNGAPYSIEVLHNFLFHAERFYQLFTVRYNGALRMTPYQIKLVDYSHFFMVTLPVPMNRLSTQGSENFNHSMSQYYFEHTTQDGGHEKSKRPTREILRSRFFQLYYEIVIKNPCQTDEQKLAKNMVYTEVTRY